MANREPGYEIYATLRTRKYNEAEKLVHHYIERFTNLRIEKKREFFNVKPEEALEIFREVATLLDDAVIEDGLRLASPRDIAAMKTYAIQNRGSRKDFIDMYFLLQHFTLEEILGFYAQKYPNYSMFRTRMALTYFEDAENKECPPMFIKVDWNDIKEFISQKVREIDWVKFE